MMLVRQINSLLVALTLSLLLGVHVAHGFRNHPSKNGISAIHHRTQQFATTSITSSSTTSVHDTTHQLQVLSKISVTQNNGSLLRIRHKSTSTKTDMTFSLFLPSSYGTLLRGRGQSIPALYWLSKNIFII